ncbi:MAG: Uma2 family endonuclease [Blastocatellia bacterium]|nr:Uma2 family endonuclease [Blastocatellia bacterium]
MATTESGIFTKPKIHRWTREEYYKMGSMGFFAGERVELIEGQVIEMSPIYELHATAVTIADDLLREVFGKGWVIRVQNPLSFGEDSDPQPDLAVIAGRARDFKDRHPSTATLVIEVADSSLSYDRNNKASLYAKGGITDYWIVNLPDRQLEIHRQPMADDGALYGFSYTEISIIKEDGVVSPLAKPDAVIEVGELLP